MARLPRLSGPGRWFALGGVLAGAGLLAAGAAGAEDENCEECHPDIRVSLEGLHNHAPFAAGNCLACHEPHGFHNELALKGDVADLCVSCHFEIVDLPHELLHYPVVEDDACLHCHVPHGAESEDLLAGPLVELCGECHDGPSEDADGQHVPFAEGECLECHSPHGSLFPSFLKLPTGYVCAGCHADVLGATPLETFHTSSDEKSCDNCHRGHESASGALLREEVPNLCFGCHGGIRERLALELPHDAAEDCLSCHDPHRPAATGTEGELCSECHDIEDEDFRGLHLGRSPEGCTGCHDPHGSARPALAREFEHGPFEERDCEICHDDGSVEPVVLRDPELCLGCHDEPKPAGAHAPGRVASRVCVDCHSPHGSESAALLR